VHVAERQVASSSFVLVRWDLRVSSQVLDLLAASSFDRASTSAVGLVSELCWWCVRTD
jgi:hypothetical protein